MRAETGFDSSADTSFSRHRRERRVGYTRSHTRESKTSLSASHGRARDPLQMYLLVQRDFTADCPNQCWLTDITEHQTVREGKLYLCAIKDVWSNRIVGYAIDDQVKASLAVRELGNAVMQRRNPANVVVHSDRGSQFGSKKFRRTLRGHKLLGSMGRVGAARDNAAMEWLFSLLQKNVLDRQSWATRQELRLAIVAWIEGKYHRKRRQRGLGRLTPVEFEAIMIDIVEWAA
ncbi:IS3 family transposase [Microbacterium sp. YY-01]|uniref:IS3 family transposase n=1 Tax=Microbacterium sp. YY-01 TaxID=3421634 RepID=UPI003D16412B